MKKWLFFLLLSLQFALFSSCGYKWKNYSQVEKYTVSIPYVEKDTYGILTDELVYRLSSLPSVTYVHDGGELDLHVRIIEDSFEQIGYRRDRRDNDELKKSVVPTEGRLRIVADVCLRKANCQEVVFGPMRVEAISDFDYVDQDSLKDLSFIDTQGNRRSILQFSLGQLESKTSAQEGAYKPLYRKLAQKIVDVISLEW